MLRITSLSTVLLLALLTPQASLGMVQVGQMAPDFSLTTPGGQTHSLSQYQGKVVVLAFIGYS